LLSALVYDTTVDSFTSAALYFALAILLGEESLRRPRPDKPEALSAGIGWSVFVSWGSTGVVDLLAWLVWLRSDAADTYHFSNRASLHKRESLFLANHHPHSLSTVTKCDISHAKSPAHGDCAQSPRTQESQRSPKLKTTPALYWKLFWPLLAELLKRV
jgi:hypothetical protein